MTTPDPVTGDDRYRPPQAHVEDSARPAARGPRPITVWIAVLVLLVTAALELVPLVNEHRLGRYPLGEVLAMLAVFGAVMAVDFALIVMIFRGAGWARLAYLAIYALMVNSAFSGTVTKLDALKAIAQTIAMLLLFTPPALAWFRHRDS
jgi:hypothetical protein